VKWYNQSVRRSFKRRVFKKPFITKENYDQIIENAEAASELLESKRFSFFIDYLKDAQSSITQMILENRIMTVQEHVRISDKLKRVFTTPKKIQIDELVGQYKFIGQVIADLENTARMKQEVEEALKKKELIMDDDEEQV
jgi:hypothetical protein